MKTFIAAIVVAAGLMLAGLPASAGYVAPDAGWTTKALAGGQD